MNRREEQGKYYSDLCNTFRIQLLSTYLLKTWLTDTDVEVVAMNCVMVFPTPRSLNSWSKMMPLSRLTCSTSKARGYYLFVLDLLHDIVHQRKTHWHSEPPSKQGPLKECDLESRHVNEAWVRQSITRFSKSVLLTILTEKNLIKIYSATIPLFPQKFILNCCIATIVYRE